MPRFSETSCSQCGKDLGPGDCGVSSCADHTMKHTPGPWLAPCGYGVSRFEVQGDGHRVAVVDRVEDARAISAVPDMLAALIVAREFISTDRNALADCSIDHEGRMSEDDAAAVADYDKALLQINAAIQKATGGKA